MRKDLKETNIHFTEGENKVFVFTCNTDLKKRLKKYAERYPDLCRQTDDDELGGLCFEMDKRRLSIRLTAPYSDERRKAASDYAKARGLKGRTK